VLELVVDHQDAVLLDVVALDELAAYEWERYELVVEYVMLQLAFQQDGGVLVDLVVEFHAEVEAYVVVGPEAAEVAAVRVVAEKVVQVDFAEVVELVQYFLFQVLLVVAADQRQLFHLLLLVVYLILEFFLVCSDLLALAVEVVSLPLL